MWVTFSSSFLFLFVFELKGRGSCLGLDLTFLVGFLGFQIKAASVWNRGTDFMTYASSLSDRVLFLL